MSAYELVYHVRRLLRVICDRRMVRKLAQRLTQCNRNSSSEDAELSAFLDQLDDRIEEEIKRADRLLEKLKTSDIHSESKTGSRAN